MIKVLFLSGLAELFNKGFSICSPRGISGKQVVDCINSTVVTSYKYFCCNIITNKTLSTLLGEGQKMDKKIRKILREDKFRFGHSPISRFYITRKNDIELGLKSFKNETKKAIVNTGAYTAMRKTLRVSRMKLN
uniref:Reverse transcriptase zinc-binding domain-containing protein n=1 Tax=Strongyloides stercoralis TaxID=6248 RepID=A0A0K0EC40_STRER